MLLGAVGGDKGILLAWRTNELQVRAKTERILGVRERVSERIEEKTSIRERRYLWDFDEKAGRTIRPAADAEGPKTNADMCEIALRRAPELRALTASIEAVLGGDLALLQKHFRLRMEGSGAAWTLHGRGKIAEDMVETLRGIGARF